MTRKINSVTKAKQFRIPWDLCERLEQHPNQTTFVIEALREKFRRDDMKAGQGRKAGRVRPRKENAPRLLVIVRGTVHSIDLRDNIMNRVIVTPSKTARQAAQQAAQAAMLLNRAGFHAQAKAIWDAAKGVIAQ
jgi:hypothetical protein